MTAWNDDACALVEAYRRGETSPREQVEASLAAIAASELNAICHVDAEAALAAADRADVSQPFGGVPLGIKELQAVAGWPDTHASVPFKDLVADHDATQTSRLRAAGGILVAQTTSSEIGLVGYTSTPLHGTTGNPWAPALTPGGSSGGSAAAVAGGLLPLASGSDGGGSLRIPAGYTGTVGLKTSFRRVPMGPPAQLEPLTSTVGCISRSVRDTARWLDVCAGPDSRDPFAIPDPGGWERGLDPDGAAGLRVVIAPDLGGGAVISPDIEKVILEAAAALVGAARLRQVEVDLSVLPMLDIRWAIPALPVLHEGLSHLGRPRDEVLAELSDEVRTAAETAGLFGIDMAAMIDPFRLSVIEGWASVFEHCDLVVCASNPDDPFAATGPTPITVGDREVEPWNAGRLTMGANLAALPAISVPAGLSALGLPVGLQIYAPRFNDSWLLDAAAALERERPWPLVVPGA